MASDASLSRDELIPEAFGAMDKDQDGYVTVDEAGMAMRLLGLYVTRKEVHGWAQMNTNFDIDGFKSLVKEALQR